MLQESENVSIFAARNESKFLVLNVNNSFC